ncbi:SDR family NAD(P)-dependent oxidoreductase, partial [Streptomyces sp. NPDC058457]|uniref:SDR family NAD(P)-dependent oxidoreductase n=1 Tax=Streptomyces sp. NPDC058457 TaxID=3346507 RepID=UPI00365BBCDD
MTAVECRTTVTTDDFVLGAHRVDGVAVLPGAAFLDLVHRMLAAAGEDRARAVLRDIVFVRPLTAVDGCDRQIHCTVSDPDARRVHDVRVRSRALREDGQPTDWQEHLTASLHYEDEPRPPDIDPGALSAPTATTTTAMADRYRAAAARKVVHDAPMRCTGTLHRTATHTLATLRLEQPDTAGAAGFALHPALLDAATLVAFPEPEGSAPGEPYLLVHIREFRAPRTPTGSCHVLVPAPAGPTAAGGGVALTRDLTLHDDDGRFVAACTGVTWKRAESPGSRRGASAEAAAPPAGRATTTDVVALLRGLVGAVLERAPESVDAQTGFYDLGLDSVALLALGRELEQVVGAPLYPTLLFEYSDINSLAAHLAAEFDIQTPAGPADVPAEAPAGAAADGPQAGEARTRCLVDRWLQEEVPRRDVGSPGPLVVMGPRRHLTELPHGAVPALRTVDTAEPRLDQDSHAAAAAEAARALDALVDPGSGAAAEVALVLPGTADETGVTDACVALWHTARALIDRGGTAGVRLHVICPGTDAHAPVPAALAALARTVTAETPRLRCRVVSAPAASGGAATAEDVRELVREAVLDPSDESEVRHEGGCRLVRRWLPAPPPSGDAPGALRHQGVYLISGGAGGLGKLVARHLVERYTARVVLAGRGSLPPELSAELGNWRGGEARYVQADVTDPEQAVRAAQETRAAFGRIDGVLHLAGVRADGVYPHKHPEEITRVLAPKALGALHLDAATATDDLDFFALFSSLSAIVPNPGQCDYAAANAFLGAFAHRRAARTDRHGRSIAIDWTYWAEGGMRLSADRVLGAGRTTGVFPLATDEGLHALEWVLHSGHARTAVLHGLPDALGSLLREAAPEARTLAPESRPTMAPPPAPDPDDGAVAVIGMAGRYPGAPDLDAFWQRLVDGDDCVTEIPADRWDHSLYYDPAKGAAGRTYGKWGGFLDRAYHFDPLFFGISRREAERMDPQERLFLSTCWHALEDAGYPPHTLRGEAVGVFAGVMWNHYQLAEGAPDGVAPFALHSSIPNRVSYTFDLTGPSIATDTSCSSSLTALHLAVESLRTGGSALALAGGVNVTTHPQKYLQLAQGQWLSTDGRCRSFGKNGTGYVPGEGVGALLLKPLGKARADGDHVYGVIRTTAINHAGRTGGATVPSPDAQARLVGAALQRAGWDPATVGYVEAHGTGTALGDPIEVTALARVFGTRPPGVAPCLLGSVKSNVGHLEGAAGIAGVTKVLLQLRHGTVAPSLHAQETNPHIDFSATPFEVPLRATPWPRQGERALRAGVSAFGAGGSNAHVLIEEYVNRSAAPRTRAHPTGARLAVLSAKDEDTLRQYARTLADRLRATTPPRRETVAEDRAVDALAEALAIPPDARDPRATLAELGVDHIQLTALPALLSTVPDLAAPDLAGVGLEETLGELAGRCAAPADTGPDALDDITYSLQVGRAPMAIRLAVLTDSVEHLVTSLGRYADGALADRARGEYWNEDADAVVPSTEECVAAFRNGRPRQCAESWTAGVDLPWEECYDPATRPCRVPLPGYPFQEEPCRLGGWRAERATADGVAARPAPDESVSDDDAENGVEQGGDMEPVDVGAVELRLLDGGIALVTLRSATFGDGMVEELESAFGRIAEDDAVRAVVLTGTGRMFSMGGDERALDSIAAGEASFSDVPFLYQGLARCDRPVICAMQGHAAGGGFTFGLHADIVVLAEEAEYRANFLSYGFTPGLGASHVLARRLGAVTAAEMLFTGRALRGGELAARGADLLVLKGKDVLPNALALARAVAQHAPAAVRALKSELARRAWSDLAPVIESEVAMHREVLGEDARRLVAQRFGALEGQSTPAQAAGIRQEHPVQESRISAEAVRAAIEESVGEVLFLRPDEIDEARSLAEMGLDSVGAVELIGRLNRRLGTDLDSVTVYDHPTVPALTEAVRADLEGTAALYREATASPVRAASAVGEPNGGVAGVSVAGTGGAPVADTDEASVAGTVRAPSVEGAEGQHAGTPGASSAGSVGASATGAGPAASPSAAPGAGQVLLAPVERVADEARTVSDAEGGPGPVSSRSIAVIGLSGRFPDATDPEAFWENLAAGRCAIRDVPPERWDVEAHFAADRRVPDRTYSKWAALMPDVDAFDASFFQLPPREAETMDPQQRLFLQEAWRALENAGYAGPAAGPRRWGVFAGCATGDYIDLLTEQGTAGTSGAFLGNAPSVLAARIAYLLDLTGPTLAVDTACSSSLVAVDLACASLLRGECETAIAGGVSVLSTPKMHIWTSKSGMLSPTGRCTPFAAEADGIVLGEAVGVVVLKPLDRAVADGDHIHGVILASGVNGDGRTNGITAPSATSQSELITRVQELAGIGPQDVGYIEAHGTGTELGDPIEVKALNAVFGPTAAEPGTIGLGSVKGNIGHTTTAAGVAGLIKVLLALRHRALPPTLGSPHINPRIDLDAGPCRVVRALEPWRPGPDGRRIAGLSSFGFSGTNCHLVIAEAPPTGPDPVRTPDEADEELIVVSGRTDAELRHRAADLARAFAGRPSAARLRSIAHTLATGHRHHAVRAAFTTTDHTGLLEGLRTIAENGPDPVPDPAPVAPQDDAVASRSASTAADVYRSGRLPHWQILFAGPPAGRVPLPPYPLTKDRHWPARPDPAVGSRKKEAGTAVDQAQETRTLRIGPDHWIVAGHRVAGRTVLPATATVCLAAAAALAEGASTPLLMRGLRWARPLEVETSAELHLALRTGPGKATVALSTTVDGAPATEHARVLLPRDPRDPRDAHDAHDVRTPYDRRDENTDGTSPAPSQGEHLDPAILTGPGTRSWSADELYRTFERGGLSYSGAFRSLAELRAHGPDEAIGTLLPLAPVSFDGTKTTTVPHPAVLDGALQSVVALLADGTADSSTARTPLLPFSVDEVCVLDPAAVPRYAHVRAMGPGTGADRRFTVRLADFEGRVCVRLDGVVLRPAAPAPAPALASPPEPPALYQPVWSPLPARNDPEPVSAPRRVAVLGDPGDPLVHALLGRNPGVVVRCVPLTEAGAVFDEREEPYDTVYAVVPGRGRAAPPLDRPAAANDLTKAVFRTVKAALAAGRGRAPLTFGIVLRGAVAVRAEEVPYPEAAAVTGLAAAMAAEYPRWRVGCLDLGEPDDARAEADRILAADWSRPLVAVRGRREYVRTLEAVSAPVSAPASAPGAPWRDGGTYLILGGTGGLGFALSKHLARRHGARLVWLGRRAPDAGVEAARAEITALGGSALYLRADAADAEALRAAVVAARTEAGPLHGVVHAALDLRDSTLATMTESDLTAVLDAKTKGALALADAVREDPLGFLVFFSSAVSFLPAAGQGNYAAASRFEDALAMELRHAGVPASTVNWGYWGGVGAVATPEYRRRFVELGIAPIEVAEGLTALERVLASALPQTLVLNGAASDLVPDLLTTSRPTLASAVRGHAELVATARDLLDRRFRGLPGIPAVGEETTIGGLAAALHLTPDNTRLFYALLDILERTGTVRRTGDMLTLLQPGSRRRSGQDEDLTDRHPGLAAHLDLLRRCVDALPDVLAGRVSGVEVLFPRGATDELARVYGGNPAADHHHALLAEEVAAEAARLARREGRTARILEIGAGTGAGTDVVLRACAESAVAVRLHYTDVSPAFLGRAKERYRDRPEVTFGPFDVERDPREQDLDVPADGYDMILAGNVLHATADLSAVLERVVSLLRPGGLLLVNEVTRADDFLTLTFGLTAGWWRFDTSADRLAHAPLLSPRQWRAALTAAGTTPERVRGLPGTPEEELAQAVFAARRRPEGARSTEPVPVTAARARRYVKDVFAEVLHFTVEALDETAGFDTFGIDSLVSLALVDRFERDLGELPSTLLFEHLTITDLAAHLIEAHGASLAAVIGPEDREDPAEEPPDTREAQIATENVPSEDDAAEPIAVIGVTGRYPGAPDLDTFWSKISEGADCVTEVPAERWDWRTHFTSQPGQPQRTYGRWGGFIDGVDLFDPAFFGILPRDAATMDPQERLFLETSWTLLQDAGYLSPRTRQPSTGVFAGTMYGAYGQLAAAGGWPRGRYGDGHSPSWSIANRVSYTLDLHGPSFTVDSACSSSLTAVHLAVQSLRRGECRMAIAGGVNLILHPAHLIALSSMNMLSRDGACKVFDESADGFAPGEGVGAVLLKPFAAAQADGDTIWAVIRGSHVNAGGRTSGYTVPNPNAQADLVREAWRASGADLRSVGYVEAHGTGTALGDPIEIAGLAKVLTGPEAPAECALGSVKANIGHLEGAAGIAGLTKVLLQLRHRRIAPCARLNRLNPKIELSGTPFHLPTEPSPWPGPSPRLAGVSSFGAGGANAHLVIEEYVPATASGATRMPGATEPAGEGLPYAPEAERWLLLSARTLEQLRAQARDLAAFLRQRVDVPLHEVAYTTQVGRAELPERLAVTAADRAGLIDALTALAEGRTAPGAVTGTAGPAGGLFDDEDGASFVAGLLSRGRPAKPARLWVDGAPVDWRGLWPQTPPRRVPLPPYPFERKRYWLPEPTADGAAPVSAPEQSAASASPSRSPSPS